MPYRKAFIMLGDACNLQCKYCLQHDIVNKSQTTGMNQDLIPFLKKNPDLHVVFYGGEPLLYLDSIKKIIDGLDGMKFSIISNGKRLTQEVVEYLNEKNIGVAISWDGKNSMQTRGFDVVKEKEELLLAIDNLCLTGVLSSQNYIGDYLKSLDEFDRKYFARHDGHITCNVDEVMDLGMEENGLTEIDLKKMQKQSEKICSEFQSFFYGENTISPIKEIFITSLISKLDMLQKKRKPTRAVCGNGYSVMNVDLRGNLYRCHNTRDCVGTIYDTYENCLGKVIQYDKTKENYATCKDCPVYAICRSGCPLVSDSVRKRYYCALKLAVYLPVMNMVQTILKKGW